MSRRRWVGSRVDKSGQGLPGRDELADGACNRERAIRGDPVTVRDPAAVLDGEFRDGGEFADYREKASYWSYRASRRDRSAGGVRVARCAWRGSPRGGCDGSGRRGLGVVGRQRQQRAGRSASSHARHTRFGGRSAIAASATAPLLHTRGPAEAVRGHGGREVHDSGTRSRRVLDRQDALAGFPGAARTGARDDEIGGAGRNRGAGDAPGAGGCNRRPAARVSLGLGSGASTVWTTGPGCTSRTSPRSSGPTRSRSI